MNGFLLIFHGYFPLVRDRPHRAICADSAIRPGPWDRDLDVRCNIYACLGRVVIRDKEVIYPRHDPWPRRPGPGIGAVAGKTSSGPARGLVRNGFGMTTKTIAAYLAAGTLVASFAVTGCQNRQQGNAGGTGAGAGTTGTDAGAGTTGGAGATGAGATGAGGATGGAGAGGAMGAAGAGGGMGAGATGTGAGATGAGATGTGATGAGATGAGAGTMGAGGAGAGAGAAGAGATGAGTGGTR
uniref:Uncharacterized protein n=1 Tax=uncultured Armatimonadetes bacterium TaxID=157466 RepID=A0A6J4IF51_9BACT|nr:hypothetical protein AVDCRST_MAG63-1918 [uncultured Armatimonadetes bacterium]